MRSRKIAGVALKLLITGALLFFVASRVDMPQVLVALRNVSPLVLVIGFVLISLCTAAQTLRWQLVMQRLHRHWPYIASWKIVVTGVFFSQFLPTSIGGDVVRVWQIYRHDTPLTKAFNSVAIDRLCAIVALVLLTLAGMPMLHGMIEGTLWRLTLWLCVGSLIAVLCLPVALARLPLPKWVEKVKPIHFIRTIASDAVAVFRNPLTSLYVTAISLGIQITVGTTVWLLATSAGAQLPYLPCLVLVPMVILISMLPLSIAGWGIREGAMVVAFGLLGVDSALALSTSVLFGLTLLASGVPGGLVWLLERKEVHDHVPLHK